MISKEFIDRFNNDIAPEGRSIMNDFFIIFSRFECALKNSGFTAVDRDKVSANWDSFVSSIKNDFKSDSNSELETAVNFIVNSPPRIQILTGSNLSWRNREFAINTPLINKLGLSIRDIRNNLFHGGKFNGSYQEDVSRNYKLLNASIIILNQWLELNDTVKRNFIAPVV